MPANALKITGILSAALVPFALVSAPAAAQANGFRTVAVSDAPAPPSDAFGDFSAPVINNAGQVAFRSTLRTARPDLAAGAFVDRNGVVASVARTADAAQGTQAFIATVGQPFLNHAGQVGLEITLEGGDVDASLRNNAAIYAGSPGTLRLAARENNPAPDLPAGTVFRPLPTGSPFGSLRFNNAGQVAFTSLLTGPEVDALNGIGLFAGAPGDVHVVTRAGQAAPGAGTILPAGTTLGPSYATSAFPVLAPAFNDAGQVLFRQELRNAAQPVGNGLFLGAPGDVRLIAATGRPAADLPTGVTYGSEPGFNLAVNARGQVAFAGTLAGSGISTENDEIVYVGAPDAPRKVVQENDLAPGAGPGVRFAEISAAREIVLNNNGRVVFQAFLKGGDVNGLNNQALYTGAQDGLSLIARAGERVPGTPEGTVYRNFFGATLNDRGEAAFIARLGGDPAVDPPAGSLNGFALIGYDPVVGEGVIAREGQVIEVAPGDFRTIASLAFNAEGSGEDGRPTGLNDAGFLTFVAFFTNGDYGVFTTNQPIASFVVPEPSALALIGSAACILMKRRRRDRRSAA